MRHGQEFQGKFDVVLGSGATQEEAYASVRGAVLSVTSGINAAVFTYGQTGEGSGKWLFWLAAAQNILVKRCLFGLSIILQAREKRSPC